MLSYFLLFLYNKTLINKIKVDINNTNLRKTLICEKIILGVGNELIKFSKIIDYGKTGIIDRSNPISIESISLIYDACGMAIYQIENKHKNNLPLLLIVGWKVSMPFITKENKWFVFVGYETDINFPNEKSINKYLNENGNLGSNTLVFKAYSIAIDISINNGNDAQLNINIRNINRSYFGIIKKYCKTFKFSSKKIAIYSNI
ncbi:hypothetical protein RclHR1_00080006 [Rhizophagus clarus]|uniref:Uncharacterized protein n=1 Tax=Rhizophagus clarus TaxID=94130 RepID=A0A2Z6SMM4_9GLOM|nr:hypothetical protein RclHR1_00080006 [Rhizophagus clarus]GET04072.1 hypothetical protein GLOIN_2v1787352 [Rhizophagus clarus]